jgi:hypothetical protein
MPIAATLPAGVLLENKLGAQKKRRRAQVLPIV